MHPKGTQNRRARAALAVALLSAFTVGGTLGTHHALAAPGTATTFTVTNTNDTGTGSLRTAITNANNNPGADTINFNIPGDVVHRISPSSPLPGISESVTIDGYTQPGASANTNPFGQGLNSTLRIEINGDSVGGATSSGLAIHAGNVTVRGLVINGFDNDFEQQGIYVGASPVTIQGNYLGTNAAGTSAVPNTTGIDVWAGSNVIGGTTAAARNLISGNSTGVRIFTFNATLNRVEGNLIGTSKDGNSDLGNSIYGVEIMASSNFIGGTASGAGNVISGNNNGGIRIAEDTNAANNNEVLGNYIGTNAAGTAAVGNGQRGVRIDGDGFRPAGNIVGGSTAGSRNVISGNSGHGIEFWRVPDGGKVLGNYIGTNAAGTAAIPNTGNGVQIDQSQNFEVGGTTAGEGNVISGNALNGINVVEGSNSNTIEGNLIGTNAAGTADLGNTQNGVYIERTDSDSNTVGGTTTSARNVISGNDLNGVLIEGPALSAEIGMGVRGNYIGTNAAGSAAVGNSQAGVKLLGTKGIVVGGAAAGSSNLISGNGQDGVYIGGEGSQMNSVQGNLIGTNAAATAAIPNVRSGVTLGSGGQMNLVGGTSPATRNIISGNTGAGLIVEENAHNNTITGNYIGTRPDSSTALANVGAGVVISGTNTVLGGAETGEPNLIAFNGGTGVLVRTSTGNRIVASSIHSNGNLGIDLLPAGVTANDANDADSGPNGLQNYPVINSVQRSGQTTTVGGTFSSKPNATYTLHFYYSPSCDASGSGEGKTYMGKTDVSLEDAGNASIGLTFGFLVPQGSFVTATATDSAGNTSEFSVCRQESSSPVTGTTTATTTASASTTAVGGATNTPVASATTGNTTATPATSATASATAPATASPTSTTGGCNISFPDVPQGSTFYSFVQCLACKSIIGGFSDGTYRPGANVTRGQLSKIISNAAAFTEPAGAQVFEDVLPGSPFYDFVQRLNKRGIIDGYQCGGANEPCGTANKPYFRPNNNATRGQISKIVAIAAGHVDPVSSQTFADVPAGSTFHKWIENLTSRGVMSGYACGGPGEPCNDGSQPYFRSNYNATRGQLAKIVSNTFFPNCSAQ